MSVQNYSTLNPNMNRKSMVLYMAPVLVKKHENDVDLLHPSGRMKKIPHGDCLEPTKESCDCNTIVPYENLYNDNKKPKESFTQTSKTIIQLAQMEHAQFNVTPKQVHKATNLNSIISEKSLDVDYGKEFDDKFSIDSLNVCDVPEKENPIHVSKATRDLQEFIDLREIKDLRLNQWVSNIKKVSDTCDLQDSRTLCTSTSQVSSVPERAKSLNNIKENLTLRKNSGTFTSVTTSATGIAAPCVKKKTSKSVNLQTNQSINQYVSPTNFDGVNGGNNIRAGKTCMTSFHNLIHLNNVNNDAGTKNKRLGVWHSQIQYGVSSSFSDMQPSTQDQTDRNHSFDYTPEPVNITSHLNVRSKSIADCERNNKVVKRIVKVNNKKLCACATPIRCQKEDIRTFSNYGSTSMVDGMHQFYQQNATNKKVEGSTFMSPTLSSQKKSLKQQVESVRWLVGSKLRSRTNPISPKKGPKGSEIPFTRSKAARVVKSEELCKNRQTTSDKLQTAFSSSTLYGSNSSCDNGFFLLLNRIKSPDFNSALKGLADIIDTARHTSRDVMMPYMTLINQRLLELLKSPRSHVARTACQLAGYFFEVMKDTRRPEFDDIVNTLLYKTADASKFIRQDANMALDAMVMHIPVFHAVRSVCAKGPTHRNPLVRCAAIRLIICAVVIEGPVAIMNNPNLESTRKRIIENLAFFLEDKNVDTRKYAERLYKIMHKEGTFDFFAKKYLNRTKHDILMNAIKPLNKKPL